LVFLCRFLRNLGLTLADMGWIDFGSRIPILRNIPLIFKLYGYRYIIYLYEMPLCFFLFDVYEKIETRIMRILAPSVFIDVGAHAGYYTILAHKLGAQKIIAIEPDIRVSRVLTRAIEVNKLNNIMVINRAAWDESGIMLKLNLSSVSGYSSLFPYDSKKAYYMDSTTQVKSITLDDVSRKLDRIDLIKIDVEGAEFNVLRGACETINRFKPLILFEATLNKEDIFNFLISRGYKCLGPLSWGKNYLAVPDDESISKLHISI
jgi:FkbM family methyltransferase